MGKKKLTTASGRPYYELDNSPSVGNRGPILLQDCMLHEDMAHFNRERIPERVVHAKGAGAFGTFTVTHDITQYTKAKLFSKIESYKEPPMQLESCTADWYDRNENDDDHFTQPGLLYSLSMSDNDRNNLVSNIVSSMSGICGEKKDEIINRQLGHFFHADSHLGMAVAKGLGVLIDDKKLNHLK